jgi:quercetin dioxygenase-like cupin family protein
MSPPDRSAAALSPSTLEAIGVGFVAADESAWTSLPYGTFEVRSLGLTEAAGPSLAALELRGGPDEDPDWGTCDSDLEAVYVLAGELSVEHRSGERHDLGSGDVVLRRRGAVSRIRSTAGDFRAVWVSASGDAGSAADWPDEDWPEGIRYSIDSPEAHVLGAGPRPEVIYRDLGSAAATAGAYRLQIVQSSEPRSEMSIWHFHDMAQWFHVLDGWATVEVNRHAPIPVRAGDSLCIGAGEERRHNVAEIGPDFTILELCTPADYRTWSGADGDPPTEKEA